MTVHEHAPVFAYEEVAPENAAELDAVELAAEEVAEAAEVLAEDVQTIDLESMSPESRLELFKKMVEDNARVRREAAELAKALTAAKASGTGTPRTKKDVERDKAWFGNVVTKIVTGEEFRFKTEKNPVGGYRYVGTVEVPDGTGKTKRVHFTLVAKDARRG